MGQSPFREWQTYVIILLATGLLIAVIYTTKCPNCDFKRQQCLYDSIIVPAVPVDFCSQFKKRRNHEPRTHELLLLFAHGSAPHTTILDIGCHIGDTAVKIATVVPENVDVLAVDPNKEKLAFLDQIVAMNKPIRIPITTMHAAISSAPGRGMEVRTGQSGAWRIKEGAEGESVPILTGKQILGPRSSLGSPISLCSTFQS